MNCAVGAERRQRLAFRPPWMLMTTGNLPSGRQLGRACSRTPGSCAGLAVRRLVEGRDSAPASARRTSPHPARRLRSASSASACVAGQVDHIHVAGRGRGVQGQRQALAVRREAEARRSRPTGNAGSDFTAMAGSDSTCSLPMPSSLLTKARCLPSSAMVRSPSDIPRECRALSTFELAGGRVVVTQRLELAAACPRAARRR